MSPACWPTSGHVSALQHPDLSSLSPAGPGGASSVPAEPWAQPGSIFSLLAEARIKGEQKEDKKDKKEKKEKKEKKVMPGSAPQPQPVCIVCPR